MLSSLKAPPFQFPTWIVPNGPAASAIATIAVCTQKCKKQRFTHRRTVPQSVPSIIFYVDSTVNATGSSACRSERPCVTCICFVVAVYFALQS